MNDQPDLADLLARHELALGRLYEVFAGAFPALQTFWQTLAEEERGHAAKLERIRQDGAVNLWLLHGSGLRPVAVASSIEYLDSVAARAGDGRLSLLHALAVARDLETALIEEQFSKIDPAVSPVVGSIIAELVEDTERHRAKILEALEVERRGGI